MIILAREILRLTKVVDLILPTLLVMVEELGLPEMVKRIHLSIFKQLIPSKLMTRMLV
jgi:hypothetical protein